MIETNLAKYDGLSTVFANNQRAAVAEFVLQFATVPPQPFTADDVVKSFGDVVPANSVASALRHLEAVGMVVAQPSPSYDRRKHLLCDEEHPFWSVVDAAARAVAPRP